MATRTIVTGIVALMAAARMAPVAAQAVTDGGCGALADAVILSVGNVVPRIADDLSRGRIGVSPVRYAHTGSPQSCGRTAAVASAAFTVAMARMNLSISWFNREPGPGDVCLDHSLTQCYPQASPGLPISGHDSAFVAAAWRSVRDGIRDQMPFGVASDISYFQRPALVETLATRLGAIAPRPAASRAVPCRSDDPSVHRRTASPAHGGS